MLSIASGPWRRLWERRRTDPDYLLLRLGTADLPSAVELTDPAADEHGKRLHWLIPDAPVTVPLAGRGVAGVAGPGDVPRSAGRWLVAQVAGLHSPEDVQICVLTDASGQAAWEWARWLPHCRPAEGQDCAALVGNDAETVAARIAELQAIIAARGAALREHGVAEGRFGHDIVVVFDGSRKLRSLPGAIGVLRDGPRVGVYSVCLDAEERLLPAECQAVAAASPDGRLVVQQMNQPAVGEVRPEYVTPAWAERLARSLAPVRDISDEDDAAGLPEACRLLDVLGLEPPDAAAIAARWQAGGRSTRAVIGACYDGPFGIDLRKDGPHGLIAGTTGAGKSELLQTMIARDLPDFVAGHRAARPLARPAPGPGHPAALRRRVGRHPGQHQPADRAADDRHGRKRRRDRRAGRRAHLPGHPWARLRPARPRLPDPVPGRADRRTQARCRDAGPAVGDCGGLGGPGPPARTPPGRAGAGGRGH